MLPAKERPRLRRFTQACLDLSRIVREEPRYWRQLFSTTFWQAPIAVGCKPKGSEARKSLADLEPGRCVRFGLSAGAGMGPSALRQRPVRCREEESSHEGMVGHRFGIHRRGHRGNSDLTASEAAARCRAECRSGAGHHLPEGLQACLPPRLLRLLRLLRYPPLLLLRWPPADRRRWWPMVPVVVQADS